MAIRSIVLLCLVLALSACDEPKTIQAWKPATKLPAETVDAARLLFDNGLADPRGCTYREATIKVRNILLGDRPDVLKIHAFQIGKTNRVIAWNGLVYDAESLGSPADLEADVEKSMPSAPVQLSLGVHGNTEGDNAKTPFHTIGKLLLLRFGRADLAERLHDKLGRANTTGYSFEGNAAWLRPTIQYLSNRLDRAVTAHMSGDDATALADAKAIEAALSALNAQATKLRSNTPTGSDPKILGFADVAVALAKDSARRISEAKPPFDLKTIAGKSKDDRIKVLIQNLDQAGARQSGQPGGVSVFDDALVKTLYYEGDYAVEPLIDCIETDNRLTRSVSYGRDFRPGRHILTVKETALRLLGRLIDSPGVPSEPGELRAYWRSNKGLSNPERWYRQLADSRNDPRIWEAAISRIVDPEAGTPKRLPGAPLPLLKGHSLRRDHNPTVSELIARRAVEVMDSEGSNSSGEIFRAESGCKLALALATWEPSGSLPTLKALTDRSVNLTVRWQGTYSERLSGCINRLVAKRIELGDKSAATDYVDWLNKLKPKDRQVLPIVVLRQLWQSPDSTEYRTIANEVFSNPASSWAFQNLLLPRNRNQTIRDLYSPIWLIPSFRKSFVAALDDRTEISKVGVVLRDGKYRLTESIYNGHGDMTLEGKVPAEYLNMSQSYRLCDFLAYRTCRRGVLKGFPEFQPYWPPKQRDQAIKEIKNFIESNGSRIKKLIAPNALIEYDRF